MTPKFFKEKKVVHLSYLFDDKFNLNNYSWDDASPEYYCNSLYNSMSYYIELYAYRHLIYALNLTHINKKDKILDLGCANGPFLVSLNKYSNKIIGLDINDEFLCSALKISRNNKYPLRNVSLMKSNGLYLPFKDESFNIIYCLGTLEHIPHTKKIIDEIFRILIPNGVFIYSIPIEIGFSLIIRQITSLITHFPREPYTFKEILKIGFLKKPDKRINDEHSHKNYDWRETKRLVNNKFSQKKAVHCPMPFLRNLNPLVIFKTIKKS